MIVVQLSRDSQGLLRACSAAGHAGCGSKGSDIVCSAVTVLLRTAVRSLLDIPELSVTAHAPERGCFDFCVHGIVSDKQNKAVYALKYAQVFLSRGISDLAAEYPEYVLFQEQIVE